MHQLKTNSAKFSIFHEDSLKLPKEYHGGKYIGEFSLKTKEGQWMNTPVAVYYQEEIPEQYKGIGSNWFGIWIDPYTGRGVISNAISAVETTWAGVVDPDTYFVIYSAYRHDYQTFDSEITETTLMVDGGQDYLKCSNSPLVKFKIVKDYIEVIENDKEESRTD